eukprot:2762964-Rhodomonas_salina.3
MASRYTVYRDVARCNTRVHSGHTHHNTRTRKPRTAQTEDAEKDWLCFACAVHRGCGCAARVCFASGALSASHVPGCPSRCSAPSAAAPSPASDSERAVA